MDGTITEIKILHETLQNIKLFFSMLLHYRQSNPCKIHLPALGACNPTYSMIYFHAPQIYEFVTMNTIFRAAYKNRCDRRILNSVLHALKVKSRIISLNRHLNCPVTYLLSKSSNQTGKVFHQILFNIRVLSLELEFKFINICLFGDCYGPCNSS